MDARGSAECVRTEHGVAWRNDDPARARGLLAVFLQLEQIVVNGAQEFQIDQYLIHRGIADALAGFKREDEPRIVPLGELFLHQRRMHEEVAAVFLHARPERLALEQFLRRQLLRLAHLISVRAVQPHAIGGLGVAADIYLVGAVTATHHRSLGTYKIPVGGGEP